LIGQSVHVFTEAETIGEVAVEVARLSCKNQMVPLVKTFGADHQSHNGCVYHDGIEQTLPQMFVDEVVHVMDVFAEMAEDGRAQRCILAQPKKNKQFIQMNEVTKWTNLP
jgi:hypothetical protein